MRTKSHAHWWNFIENRPTLQSGTQLRWYSYFHYRYTYYWNFNIPWWVHGVLLTFMPQLNYHFPPLENSEFFSWQGKPACFEFMCPFSNSFVRHWAYILHIRIALFFWVNRMTAILNKCLQSIQVHPHSQTKVTNFTVVLIALVLFSTQ